LQSGITIYAYLIFFPATPVQYQELTSSSRVHTLVCSQDSAIKNLKLGPTGLFSSFEFKRIFPS